jgi:hypothetical protein
MRATLVTSPAVIAALSLGDAGRACAFSNDAGTSTPPRQRPCALLAFSTAAPAARKGVVYRQ